LKTPFHVYDIIYSNQIFPYTYTIGIKDYRIAHTYTYTIGIKDYRIAHTYTYTLGIKDYRIAHTYTYTIGIKDYRIAHTYTYTIGIKDYRIAHTIHNSIPELNHFVVQLCFIIKYSQWQNRKDNIYKSYIELHPLYDTKHVKL